MLFIEVKKDLKTPHRSLVALNPPRALVDPKTSKGCNFALEHRNEAIFLKRGGIARGIIWASCIEAWGPPAGPKEVILSANNGFFGIWTFERALWYLHFCFNGS